MNNTTTKPTKYFVKIDGDSSGEMRVEPEVRVFDTFEEAKANYRRLRLSEYISCDEAEDREFTQSEQARIDALADPGRDCVVDSFAYENRDLDDEDTYMNLEISLVRSSNYKTKTAYEL